MNKDYVLAFYVILMVLAAIIAYKTSNNNMMYAGAGALAGVAVSAGLWFAVGQKMSE